MGKHQIVHVELPSTDPQRAAQFYGELFGWRIVTAPGMDYIMFDPEAQPGGGFPATDDVYTAGGAIVHVTTDDIEASLAHVASLGGQTVVPKTEIPGMGWYAVFRDPSGNKVGLYTDANGAD
jgi:predicted enzyme related to lactoylglutathione lyase